MQKKRRTDPALETLNRDIRDLDAKRVDHLYGLEPIYEPGQGTGGVRPEEFVAFQCPWCGERLESRIDVSAGEHSYVEDCQVCCRPMELAVEVAADGAFAALRVQRVE
ncbi:MAG TPA: CPXCG motif-containing cysteine-rich protein [Steroidobacteraceae bacterium]|nr:CPXCG motif-containing cysteine-rich protein [Steroidobacteraceae bacterium]